MIYEDIYINCVHFITETPQVQTVGCVAKQLVTV